ncbi:hypothetical protein [Amycolatopsis sp.]|jgi:subtilase family serine protease|uniref:hypothetical protein n=1 Tax=Amycolatopsis sp. TaxID=37632 RepID=UPI00262C8CD3|nr:hypothetical protein [Amycolatopsis sp.]
MLHADLTVVNGTGGHPLASMTSNSWDVSGGEATVPSEFMNIAHSILLRAAAEGIGMYFCSQDLPGVAVPAADPYAAAVGGTSLAINANNQCTFETGWSDDVQRIATSINGYNDLGIQGAAGGGASLLWSQPCTRRISCPRRRRPRRQVTRAAARRGPYRTLAPMARRTQA